jgi:hypothetical protein
MRLSAGARLNRGRERAGVLLHAGALAATGPACTKLRCTGNVIECHNLGPACAATAGCVASPGCILWSIQGPFCAGFTAEATCAEPKCSWVGGRCISHCETLEDQTSCQQHAAPGQTAPDGQYLWTCNWVDCRGTPKKQTCSEYSNDECPARLGCHVEQAQYF